MKLSLILPVYNGCEELRKNFMPIYDAIGRNRDSEIIIAEDGSTDGTKAAAKELAKKHRRVKVISRPKRS
ncbi:MAG: glycosyltransferase, partial [Candidatus Micrarchaeota archaeon]|nr:glycosyltransferase [Candidatus Micrarchaeota archaeon]